jgi:hypothetical protein
MRYAALAGEDPFITPSFQTPSARMTGNVRVSFHQTSHIDGVKSLVPMALLYTCWHRLDAVAVLVPR